jgi:hypothetical protein
MATVKSTPKAAAVDHGRVHGALAIMQKHAHVIESALRAPIEVTEKDPGKAIAELASVHVLLPHDDSSYYLNPNLRNFILDLLNKFGASESLTRLTPIIKQVKKHFHEIQYLESQGEVEDAERYEEELTSSVSELFYACKRNLELLNSQLSSDYGNVKSLKAKLRQNTLYDNEIKTMLEEYRAIEELLQSVDQPSRGPVQSRAKQMMLKRLEGSRLEWFKRLNDVQSIISKRRFSNKLLARRLLNLSKAALWLTQNPTLAGIEVDFAEDPPDALIQPQALRIKSNVDVRDMNPKIREQLQSIMGRLPPAKDPFRKPDLEPDVAIVSRKEMPVIHEVIDPIDQLIMDAMGHLRTPGAQPLSLRDWKRAERQTLEIQEESWIFYAATQLISSKFEVSYQQVPAPDGFFNTVFEDILVMPPQVREKVISA